MLKVFILVVSCLCLATCDNFRVVTTSPENSIALSANSNYLDSVPQYLGTVKANKPAFISPKCFQVTTVSMTLSGNTAHFNIQSDYPVSWSCLDWFLLSDGRSFKLKAAIRKGDHKFSVELAPDQVASVKAAGFHVFQISLNIINYLKDAIELYEVIKKEDPFAIKKLMEDLMDFKYEQRSTPFIDPIKIEPYIKSGDVIAMVKYNSVEAIIMSGSLSRAGHSAMFLRDPDTQQLYVVEAQPAPQNIFKTPFDLWIKTLTNGTFDNCYADRCNAVWLPLSDEARKYFDERKAWNYFLHASKNFPYSSFAEVFSAIDSIDPKSWAYPLSPSLLPFAGVIADNFSPEARDMYFLKSYEKRLNLPEGYFKTFAEILEYCDGQGIDIIELSARPELDSWRYDGLPSLQCSSFVVSVLKAAGVVDGLTNGKADLIQAVEFMPRDIYLMGIYKTGRPAVCDVDDLPYCQILGLNKIVLPGWNSQPLYAHMNEKCPINPPPPAPRVPEFC
ncbi:hypothetical protein RCL1_001403 [Eukaryota sp. TZLM3-RCL]